MGILDVSNIINVTVTDTPSGLITPNVNAIGLFTNEMPSNSDPYQTYVSAAAVAADYGSNSVTAQMANAVFSQVPNILSGDGYLAVIPLIGSVSATAGNFTTADISANVANFNVVTNGNLKVTLDSIVHNLTGLNFSNIATLADIAVILQAALPDANVTSNATTIEIQSKKVGTAASVALATYAGGGTDLTGTGLLHTATGVVTAGVNSSGETILAAIARTATTVAYVGMMTNLNLEDAAISAIAAGVQAMDKMFFHHCASSEDIAGIATTISTATETKTRLVLYTHGQAAANLMKSAYVGRAFSVQFSGSNTSQTMNLKSLATITPDLGITETLYLAALTAGIDLYVSFAGVPSVVSTGGNQYFDNVYADISLKFDLETAGFNYLRQTNTKVPQTESGMNGLKNAYAQVMARYVINNTLAPGQWDSSETFGDPAVFTQNITNVGYYIYSTPIAQQSSADRDQRKAPLVQIAAKRAGAIHKSDVLVIINA